MTKLVSDNDRATERRVAHEAWEALTYSVDKGGYVVNMDKDRLDRDQAPSFRRGEEPTWDTDYDTRIRDYYR